VAAEVEPEGSANNANQRRQNWERILDWHPPPTCKRENCHHTARKGENKDLCKKCSCQFSILRRIVRDSRKASDHALNLTRWWSGGFGRLWGAHRSSGSLFREHNLLSPFIVLCYKNCGSVVHQLYQFTVEPDCFRDGFLKSSVSNFGYFFDGSCRFRTKNQRCSALIDNTHFSPPFSTWSLLQPLRSQRASQESGFWP
jgi:hypothetical protein